MQRKQVQSLSLIALLSLMLILMARVFVPYLTVILWSSITYIIISPIHHRLLRRLDRAKPLYEAKRHVIAGVFALGTIVIMVSVLGFIGFQLIGQGKLVIEGVKTFVEGNSDFFVQSELGATLTKFVGDVTFNLVDLSTFDLKDDAVAFLTEYSSTIARFARGLVTNIGKLVLTLVFMCFTLYFFYLDGSYLGGVFIGAIPINRESTARLIGKFREVTRNLFAGFFLVALYQAFAAFVIFAAFRVEGALLFAVLILFSSFVPMLGCAMVWLPLAASLFATRGMATGLVFSALCAVFISFLDNFMRPLFLKDRIKIHPLLIFFSILGGVHAFGFNGIILGPIVIILFFTIVDIALEEDPGLPAMRSLGDGESDESNESGE